MLIYVKNKQVLPLLNYIKIILVDKEYNDVALKIN